jgi:hypothetical protein
MGGAAAVCTRPLQVAVKSSSGCPPVSAGGVKAKVRDREVGREQSISQRTRQRGATRSQT